MSDGQPNGPWLPPPSGPPASPGPVAEARRAAWWKRRWWKLPVWAWILIGVVVIGGAAGGAGGDDGAPAAESETTTPDDGDTTEAETTTPAVVEAEPKAEPETITIARECQENAVRFPDSGRERCVDGQWEAFPVTTSPPPASTVRPTTTIPQTTTTTTTLPPQPIVYEGVGDSVIEIQYPGGAQIGVLDLTHAGNSNFAVWSLDSGLSELDLLVNVIGSYSGTVLDAEGAAGLEITADGPWTVTSRSILDVSPFAVSTSGRGDSVIFYIGDTAPAVITHTGESNFAIWAYSSTETDLLVNEIGSYSGTVRMPGQSLLAISADGDWSISAG